MGAEYVTLIVRSDNKSKVEKEFKKAQEVDRYENGHSYSGGLGMAFGLEFHNDIFESRIEANNYLDKTVQKWDNAIAVRYKDKSSIYYLIGALCSC